MIECLLTGLGQAGHENIWLSVRMHGPVTALSPYILTSSQIFFCPALPLSEGNNLLHITVFESRFFFLTDGENIFPTRKCDVLNRGFSGYTSAFNKLILPRILQCDHSPKGSVGAVVLLLGSNDSVVADLDQRGLTVEQYITNMTDIILQFKNDGISAGKIVLLTPPAISIDMYTEFCKEQGNLNC